MSNQTHHHWPIPRTIHLSVSPTDSSIPQGPEHVAIIMDGNGRWAKQRGLIRSMGHERGGHQVREILRAAFNLDVKQLTLYAFSSENWKRPKQEVTFLHNLLVRFLKSEVDQLNKDNVRFKTIGDLSKFPEKVQKAIFNAKDVLKNNSGIVLCLALNYGSRNEIVEAAKAIARQAVTQPEIVEYIDEKLFSDHLFTAQMPDVDLMIRTGGDQRISNFLLWQISYSELYFTPVLWPDFSPQYLQEAIAEFKLRHRRFGGL
jgi:undecaprenyl diphosphate synthase